MLRYSADIRTLIVVALYFVFTGAAWYIHATEWYYVLPTVMLLCVWSFFCAAIIHNTIHSPIFKTKFANRVFQVVLSFTYGYSVSAFVPGHNFSHHMFTQTPMDDMRTEKLRFRWNFLNQLLFFFVVSNDIVSGEMRFVKRAMKEKPSWFKQYLFELVLVMSTKIALVILDWRMGLMYVVIPHLYAVWGIVSVNYWQHDGCDETHPYNHTRNFTGSWLNWITFNNGYHSAHHEKPGLHWSQLPAYHQEHIVPHIHPNLDQKNLFTYLWKTCVYPGKRIDYLGNPMVLKDMVPDQDWVSQVKLGPTNIHMGVEA